MNSNENMRVHHLMMKRGIYFQPVTGEVKNKTIMPKDQNNANNAYYFTTGLNNNNNNKNNGYAAVVFYEFHQRWKKSLQ